MIDFSVSVSLEKTTVKSYIIVVIAFAKRLVFRRKDVWPFMSIATSGSIWVVFTFQYCCVHTELRQLAEKQKVPVDLDTYIRKLAISKKKLSMVHDILDSVHVSCNASKPGWECYRLNSK